MKHTPGLLAAEINQYGRWFLRSRKDRVASVTIPDFDDNGEGNAKRLVACWNACEGMDDPAVEIALLREEDFLTVIKATADAAITKATP